MKDFEIISHLKAAQNLVAKHYESNFELTFNFNAAQMKEDRLTSLALMAMNKNRFNLHDAVLDHFSRKNARILNHLLE